MKSVNAAVSNAIRTAYDINAIPRLTVEWNFNRIATNVTVDNDPSDDLVGYDIEMFPAESMIQPNRPTAGILKARVNEARVSDPYSQYDGKARSARYYIGDVDDLYKYWTSPYQTNGSGAFPTDSNGSMVRPHVLYPDGISINKIVVGFEDTWAQPNAYEIRIRETDGGAWVAASTSPTINSKGQAIIYYNGTGWSSNKPSVLTNRKTIYGVQVRITSMKGVPGGSPDGSNAFANIIEISARREEDLSDRLVNVSDTFDMGEKSQIYPLGTITSNTASVSLFNGDGVFNRENKTSTYKNLMEPNAVFNLEYVYTVGGTEYPVQQFKMYGGPWMGQRAETVEIECADFSKYFQETKPRATTYNGLSVAEIVWRICDSVGFVDYEIQGDDITTQHKIPIFWADGEKTVWQIFDELAKATQTAIYFDAWGRLQVRTRTAAFNTLKSVDWVLRGVDAGSELADIVDLEQNDELESNNITVTYQTTEFNPIKDGLPVNQVLWEPEDTVALRSAPLLRTLLNPDDHIWLTPADAKIWPYEGMVNIQGELIRYKGKRFVFYEGGTRKAINVKSQEEYEKYNNRTAEAQRHRNHFTGQLVITERGVWNSEKKRHPVEAEGYSVRNIINGSRNTDVPGFRQIKADSQVVLASTPRVKSENDFLFATRGASTDSGFYYYGTRFKFKKDGRRDQRAGMVIHSNGNNEDGYYIEITPSSKLATAKERALRHELIFFTRVGGVNKKIGPNNGRGIPLAIVEGVEYEIDVTYSVIGSDHLINIWVNGKNCMTPRVSGADKNAFGGRFGMFTRGDTKAAYEYLYAIARQEDQPEDDFSFLDKVQGGYTGGQWDREWVYRWRTQRRRTKKGWTKERERWNRQFFDEFGPYVHEVREFDVKFDPAPALTNRLYLGNDYSVICPEYKGNSFGAKFYIANTDRKTAIVHGEDTLRYAGQSTPVNPVMAVIGRAVVISEAESVNVKNDTQIRRRGNIETEITSPWIQKKVMAQEIAEWIEKHWSKGADEQQVTIFGNPLLELGDVVTVDYPEKDMTVSTHKYFVVGTSSSFDSGLETQITLRRVV